ncbi:hypothetical protein ECP02994384_3764, partial [Escherichia coli P0299438.4]
MPKVSNGLAHFPKLRRQVARCIACAVQLFGNANGVL